MTLRWSETAAQDLISIYEYIAQDKPATAAAIVESIVQAAEQLEKYPALGHRGRSKGARELVHPPFVIVYRVVEDIINVEAVFHGSRRYE